MTIQTEADIIRVIIENRRLLIQALREDAELLDEVRHIILTEDLLALPAQVAELIETQNQMLETQDQILRTQDRMEGRLGNLEGERLERRLFRILPARLFPMYGLRRPRVLLNEVGESPLKQEFVDRLGDAAAAGIISDEQYGRLLDTDLIMSARRRKDGKVFYIAVEASGAIARTDIVRAVESSEALRAIYDETTLPVVVGHTIQADMAKLADEKDVVAIIVAQDRAS